MKIRTIIGAAAISVMSAAAAFSATLLDSSDSGGNFDILFDDYQFQDTFADGTPAQTLTFTFDNTSAVDAIVTISSATINQQINSFITGGASVWWSGAGVVASAAQGVGAGGNLNFVLGAGASDTLNVTLNGVVGGSSTIQPDIDFFVSTAAVPVPAGLLLLGTGLAGLGVMRRRKKAVS